jgi:hypothetical protein
MAEPKFALKSATNEGRVCLDVRAGTRTVTLHGWSTEDWPAIRRLAEITPSPPSTRRPQPLRVGTLTG